MHGTEEIPRGSGYRPGWVVGLIYVRLVHMHRAIGEGVNKSKNVGASQWAPKSAVLSWYFVALAREERDSQSHPAAAIQ